ncbi:MAG TPA: polyprenyl synthetase family protein [Ignavibacteriales bacterium]|nr:polyprenyl synthetase family protein [Ignavibacteriales bacterium]HPD68394.1 polyprenyl synthetase family protein [Ignavibacteriales bacterium]HRR19501.1 polyprenyl synthetase family protein [Ignavibacteriales bacterium]HRT99458.1 polyprenyl synthetase family protein [Ignavibacteriales bacterium]
MSNALSNIQNFLDDELKEFNKRLKKDISSKVLIVDLITKYILYTKGKQLRPLLVLLSAKVCGGIAERTYRAASLVEILHTATLVHDDVVDEAEKRRGFPSLYYIWKSKVSVLMGDYLLSKGLMVAVDNGDYDFLQSITHTVKRMAEGELLQIGKAKKLDLDIDTYYKIISDKTASLISTCCEVGAMSASNDQELRLKLKEVGEAIGIAFQIKDDILDFVGSSSGKNKGADLKEKKFTLPLLYALSVAEKSEAKKIKYLINKKNISSFDTVLEFINKYQGLEYAQKKAEEIAEQAKKTICSITDDKSAKLFCELIDFIVTRNK